MKTLLLIFSLLNVLSSQIYDDISTYKPLVVEIGLGDNSYLEISNCQIIEGYVNWEHLGEYEIIYYDYVNIYYFSRKVYVISPYDLEVGYSINTETIFSIPSSFNYKIKDCIKEDSDSFFVIGTISYDEDLIQTILLQEYAFIQYYKGNLIVYEKIFDTSYSYISWAYLSEAGLVYYLTYTNGDNTNIQIGEISHQGTILRSKIIGGSKDELGFCGFKNGSIITLFMVSSSKDSFWLNKTQNGSILVILELDSITWQIKKYLSFGNNIENNFIDCYMINNSYYCLIYTIGLNGNFINSSSNNNYFLVVINNDLTITKYITIMAIQSYPRLITGEQNIYILYNNFFQNQTQLSLLEYDLSLVKLNTIIYNHPHTNTRLYYTNSLVDDNGNTTMYFDHSNPNLERCFCGIFYIEGINLKSLGSEEKLLQTRGYIDNSTWSYIGIKNNYLVKKAILFIKTILFQQTTHSYYLLKEKYVLVNGRSIGENGVKSLDINHFGYYIKPQIINNELITLVIKNEFFIPLDINIRNNEVYDRHLHLTFNSNAYLDDFLIENETIVTEYGLHQLIILGEGDIMKIIKFTIKDLSLQYKSNEAISSSILNRIDFHQESRSVFANNNGYYLLKKDYSSYLILVLFIITSFVSGFLIKKPFRRTK